MTKRKTFSFLIPPLAVLVGALLLFTSLDAKISDLFQRTLPATPTRDDVILIGIDDFAIETIGAFPFTRDIYADCIAVMEELGTESAVFDLSFLENAVASVNENFEPFYPDEVMQEALEKSKITYLNFTFDYQTDISDYEKEIMDEVGLYNKIKINGDTLTQEFSGVTATIPEFLIHACGAGYVNTDPDSDNYYRRVNPVAKYDGNYYLQLTFPALLKRLGNPEVVVENRKITLKNVELSDGKVKDVVIPRGNDGKLILKYPKMQFNEYNYLSLGEIYHLVQLRRWMSEDGEEEFIDEYNELYSQLKSKLDSSICIIGTCATSTSDYGVNLYEAQYPLPGVHYTFANQILNEDFICESPVWISIIYALIFSILAVLVTTTIKSTGGKISLGLFVICVDLGILFAIYHLLRLYVGSAIPFVSVSLAYVSTIVMGFLSASKDKKFITNAFSQCLSKDVVKQIVDHPESFKLGGETIEMTAVFTDIQKFSSFSELLSASELVALLNYYLTKMSDIIMEQGGTIDKYEGDAIIALVGAPLKMPDHATRAVRAALNMKAAEKLINQEIKSIASLPRPSEMDVSLYNAFSIMVKNGKEIFTRIGINSGEMIAGYMGSENKKNYTMMGNNVNLASRLEGVNKQYSTFGILVSEATFNLLDKEIFCRRLDKVQVVNVNTPLTLYEPVSLKENAGENLEKYLTVWEKAMQDFDSENYAEACEKFKKLAAANPRDKVASYYVRLLEKFFLQGKTPQESDDFGVVYNPELKCFRLLSK